ncbi:MAG: hypothetical protein H8E74_11975 [Gammaproteobacteria bacterium]|jgi:hypothetical protein|nr:hypothetical protein [Gammaproteobacteria bacterium]
MKMKALHINKLLILTLFFVISCGGNNRATQSTVPIPVVVYTPGDLVSDGQGYIQYRVGNTPVIITVPHDGTLVPSNMADRIGDVERAVNTRKVAEQFAVFFNANSNGLFPHIIYNNVSRTKLDPDANLMDGAQGNSYANLSYGTYHSYLQTAIDSVEANFDSGILLNLVEHDNATQQFELGYLLSESELNLSDAELNNGYSTLSSISQLSSISAATFSEVLRGYSSFGNFLFAASYNGSSYQVVPNLDNPNAPSGGYTSGGFTLTTYGKERLGKINAIEVATPYSGFRDNANAYRAVGVVLEDATYRFYQEQIGISIY